MSVNEFLPKVECLSHYWSNCLYQLRASLSVYCARIPSVDDAFYHQRILVFFLSRPISRPMYERLVVFPSLTNEARRMFC